MEKAHETTLPPGLVSLQLGVWRIVLRRGASQSGSIKNAWQEWKVKVSEANVGRLFQDIYHLGPLHFAVAVSSHCLAGVEDAISLWTLNKLLHLIEAGYKVGQYNSSEILKALFVRVLFMCLVTTWRWIASRTSAILATRVTTHFEERILHAHLSLDLATTQKNSGAINVFPATAWDAFDAFLGTIRVLFTTVSQLLLIATFMVSEKNSLFILMLGAVWPVLTVTSRRSLWSQPFIAYATSAPYKRLRTIYELMRYKKEVIGGGLAPYIKSEYRKARDSMGDASVRLPWELYSLSSTPLFDIGGRLFQDFPLIYYAVECMWNNSPLSIASLATMQQLCGTLESTVTQVVLEKNNILDNLRNLRELYYDYGAQKDAKSSLVPYSSTPDVGMGIELRCWRLALHKISFTIAPSSLVVIVGANGSGKSSLVNLLTGLYNPTSGDILIDGLPAGCYDRTDLQSAVALLTQDHNVFSLSLAETIGIGDPDAVDDMRRIEEAARLGGAYDFVKKSSGGFDDVLQPVQSMHASNYPMNDEELRALQDNIEKQREISGGEKQRVAASRTFMRIMSEKVRLVVVDEPTSAMDPLGEYELFEKLRSFRAGKTMVFVTHRFGHLTRYADAILCMKDGYLIERGTHRELIANNGEYSRLYNIQASAFSG